MGRDGMNFWLSRGALLHTSLNIETIRIKYAIELMYHFIGFMLSHSSFDIEKAVDLYYELYIYILTEIHLY